MRFCLQEIFNEKKSFFRHFEIYRNEMQKVIIKEKSFRKNNK